MKAAPYKTGYLQSHKPSKKNEQNLQGTAEKSKDKLINDVLLLSLTHGQQALCGHWIPSRWIAKSNG